MGGSGCVVSCWGVLDDIVRRSWWKGGQAGFFDRFRRWDLVVLGGVGCWVFCTVLYCTMIAKRHDPDPAWAAQAGGRCVSRRQEAGRSVAGLRRLEQPRSCTISDWCLCVMHGGGGSCHVVLGGMIFLACVLLSWLIEVDWIGIGIGRGRAASRPVRHGGRWPMDNLW